MPEKTEFLPFHAINEYMRPDFRLKIIRDTLTGQNTLDEHLSNDLNQHIKKNVSVPGFRSSDKAPALIKSYSDFQSVREKSRFGCSNLVLLGGAPT